MTQSPGRDSPGSSGSGSGSRHSTASLDSGRASGYHLGPRGPGALASSPRCSISSLGSHPDRPADLDVVHAWLTELQFEEYFPLFASAGYDRSCYYNAYDARRFNGDRYSSTRQKYVVKQHKTNNKVESFCRN